MEFLKLKKQLQVNLALMLTGQTTLFTVDVDKDMLWNTYLDSFPEGTNPVYREKREHDCSCCRQFVKNFGNVVAIKNNQLISIWDFDADSTTYSPVITALSKVIHAAAVQNVFVTKEVHFGTDVSYEHLNTGATVTWQHFYAKLPASFRCKSSKSIGEIMGEHTATKGVFKRSLEEISQEAFEIVLELISQKSLYKGEEWQEPLKAFLKIHKEYKALDPALADNFCWSKSMSVGPGLSRIKNHSIGVLLTDITEGMDLDVAVRRYEKIVAPSNYKRPKAIFTAKMVEQAQSVLAGMGLLESLDRRFATLDDITHNNILFANCDAGQRITGGVFDMLKAEVAAKPQKFDKVEEIGIDDFVNNVLPTATFLEAYVENKHISNMVSLIAPAVKESKSLFKWNNNFCWAYNGNITDSMRENVKAAGGNVDGVLRFSIQWNENGDNQNDFDAHCKEPGKTGVHIYYPNKGTRHRSSGMLDVDIISPGKRVAVENIIYTSLAAMPKGAYEFGVKTFSYNGGQSGFSAELEYNGQIYSFEYRKPTRTGDFVPVVKVEFDGTDFKIIESLESSVSSREVWGVKTNQFVPVSVCMFSPNYWDAQNGIGHRHFMFMLKNCINDESPNGFFNEFLKEELNPHRKVFEALGGKMKVVDTPDQLSGLGFSATKRNSLVLKVTGKITRVLKVNF